jgi:hypothetical protein
VDPLIVALRKRARDPARATDEAFEFSDPAPPPLDELSVQRAEARLGRPLPPLLREIYRFVGNGGLGPGYGLLPLTRPDESEEFPSVVWHFEGLSAEASEPGWSWPETLLPFCDWGCAIQSCIDTSSRDGAVFTFDPGAFELRREMSDAFAQTHESLRAWLSDWLGGVKIWNLMFEPDPGRTRTGINPFTKEPITLVPNKLRRAVSVDRRVIAPPVVTRAARRVRGTTRLELLEFISRARRQAVVVVERTVNVPGPSLRALLDKKRAMPLTEVLAHPDQHREQRSFRHGHILGPGLSERELATWQERHPEARLSASVLNLLREVDGIHLWADLDRGGSHFGVLPLREWVAAHQHVATGDKELPRSALVVSYHENSGCFLVLDTVTDRFTWFDAESSSDSDVVAESVEEWLGWWWEFARELDPRNQTA